MEPIAPALKNIQQNATKWKVKIPDINRGILKLLPHFSIKTPNENNKVATKARCKTNSCHSITCHFSIVSPVILKNKYALIPPNKLRMSIKLLLRGLLKN